MTRKQMLNMSDSKLNETVQIAGTNYDRRRKITNNVRFKMSQMVEAGKSYTMIADHFDVSPYTVKLNTNKKFRAAEYARRANYPQYSKSSSAAERAEYKRDLLAAGKKLNIKA